jgi:hypothetical protein
MLLVVGVPVPCQRVTNDVSHARGKERPEPILVIAITREPMSGGSLTDAALELIACTEGRVDGVSVKKAICEAIIHLRIHRADIGIEVFIKFVVRH